MISLLFMAAITMARVNTAVVFHTLYTDLLAMSTPGVGVMAVTTTPTFRYALIYESNNFPRLLSPHEYLTQPAGLG